MLNFECLSSPVERGVLQVAQNAKRQLFIAAPYISRYGIDIIIKNTRAQSIKLLTNLNIESIANSSLDVKAILNLWEKFELKISSLGKLHAKIYIADENLALITSANLTRGGLRDNYEYGVIIRDGVVISTISTDMKTYFELGNIFERGGLANLLSGIEEIQKLQKQLDSDSQQTELYREISKKQNDVKERVLLNRIREGKTVNSIFSDTIIYLLGNKGVLSTQELHPLIQNIHPDICDDSIDRIIGGQHFGKKWKHLVRNAQQSLKQRGAISLQEGKWHLNI